MAINLQPITPFYCEACANFKVLTKDGAPTYGRCLAPEAPQVHPGADGEQYISREVPDSSRPFASSMRRDADKCGPLGEWFKYKSGAPTSV